MQRFFNTAVSWDKVQWLIIAHHLLDQEDVVLLAGDEVVVTKSGKKMVNPSQVLIRTLRTQCFEFSVNDLKACYRGRKYVTEAFKPDIS